ncbi:Alpha-1,3/1,6-mannosyltransferase ALG2 [Oopsacas minuta]|uniref:Alpha-1,3/1,6-mannosyltransferase ALG2 n=1 Tax=Oopsacas minuta TaxID=111878 RepID=A0AAV7JZV7_9METZ|nr:Alpha-1,3/1,6-mannosyltransferase ALG2 [Oopsacas minuta]
MKVIIDNVTSHTAKLTKNFLDVEGLELLPHPPYSPDLAPCDFWLSPKLKIYLQRKDFNTLQALSMGLYFKSIPEEEYSNVSTIPSILPSNLEGIYSKESIIFLSLNRFECKKNISLAIRAFDLLSPQSHSTLSLTHDQWARCVLVIAGGYDERVSENIRYYSELSHLSVTLGLDAKVYFLRSISSDVKLFLLANSFALLYTPEFEHFGIVPIEAMYMNLPVIAHNSGGPKETIISGKTGILCESGHFEFAQAMRDLIFDKERTEKKYSFGSNGRLHVLENFSFDAFAYQLDKLI